jgi:hypothetical protein
MERRTVKGSSDLSHVLEVSPQVLASGLGRLLRVGSKGGGSVSGLNESERHNNMRQQMSQLY